MRNITRNLNKNIPLFKVFMPETVVDPLTKVLLSGYIGQGPQVLKFEKHLENFLNCTNVVTVNSGTSGLHLALRLIGIGKGDEVLTSSLTCTATNWPIILAGAIPIWCDVEIDTCNINPKEVEKKITPRTKAIIAIHWGGSPCNLSELYRISHKYNIPLIEDCAHAFGSKYDEKKVGSFGKSFCMFSFQAIKHITTIDGGCLTLPQEEVKRAKLLRWYGINRENNNKGDFRCEGDIYEVGDKLHMNDICATIGIEQMKHINSILEKHRDNAQFYFTSLRDIPGITLLKNVPGSAWWLYTIRVEDRISFMKYMKNKGIMTSRVHERNDRHSCVKEFQCELPNVDILVEDMVCIPVGWWVGKEDRSYIIETCRSWSETREKN